MPIHQDQITNSRQVILQPNQIVQGDCIEVMQHLPDKCIDLVVTDPPYLVNYKDRSNRSILNDKNEDWLKPAFDQVFRVLKWDSMCISFYGWHKIDVFMEAWKAAGFTPVGHIVWQKPYASSSRFLEYRHEQAYLLAKGRPQLPQQALPDVQPWHYSGNRFHPTQKSSRILEPLIEAFSQPNDIVLDPFCGSASTAVAAHDTGRRYLAIEKDPQYHQIAQQRLQNIKAEAIPLAA